MKIFYDTDYSAKEGQIHLLTQDKKNKKQKNKPAPPPFKHPYVMVSSNSCVRISLDLLNLLDRTEHATDDIY